MAVDGRLRVPPADGVPSRRRRGRQVRRLGAPAGAPADAPPGASPDGRIPLIMGPGRVSKARKGNSVMSRLRASRAAHGTRALDRRPKTGDGGVASNTAHEPALRPCREEPCLKTAGRPSYNAVPRVADGLLSGPGRPRAPESTGERTPRPGETSDTLIAERLAASRSSSTTPRRPFSPGRSTPIAG
jgi:hypothetical protein